jgi:hypothetical protein
MSLIFNCILRLGHRNSSVSVAGVVGMAGIIQGYSRYYESCGGILDISKDMGVFQIFAVIIIIFLRQLATLPCGTPILHCEENLAFFQCWAKNLDLCPFVEQYIDLSTIIRSPSTYGLSP